MLLLWGLGHILQHIQLQCRNQHVWSTLSGSKLHAAPAEAFHSHLGIWANTSYLPSGC